VSPIARAGALVAAVAFAAAAATAPAWADGDPASDVLLFQNAYFPAQAPSRASSDALERIASAVYRHGERVKIAIVYDPSDLGSVPSLYGDASGYARFLGLELSFWYAGPLVVVMPAGLGVYDGGRSTSAAEAALQSVRVASSTPDELTRSATAALEALDAAGALRSPDVRAPLVTPHPASAALGKEAALRFDLYDDSGYSSAVVRVYEDRSTIATLVARRALTIGTRNVALRWLVPAVLRSRRLRFCVVASDPAGNRSAPACAPFLHVT
jgi:hypothetical protein